MNVPDSYKEFDNERGRNDRYSYAKVEKGDKTLFYKRAKSPELREGLLREGAWSDFMTEVHHLFPDVLLRGPVVNGFVDADTLAFEFINAPHLADIRDLDSWVENIDRYAEMLVVLDKAAENWTTTGVSYQQHRTQDAFAVWHEWLGENATKVTRLDEAKTLVNDYMPHVTTRMQHGDLTPWQIFNDNGMWIIYDGEKCGTDLARYNDLAYGYGRLFTLLRSREIAADLLTRFIDKSDVNTDEFARQFLPVMTGRAVGMLSDALNDQLADDYVEEANLLLDLCLMRSIDGLLSD